MNSIVDKVHDNCKRWVKLTEFPDIHVNDDELSRERTCSVRSNAYGVPSQHLACTIYSFLMFSYAIYIKYT